MVLTERHGKANHTVSTRRLSFGVVPGTSWQVAFADYGAPEHLTMFAPTQLLRQTSLHHFHTARVVPFADYNQVFV
jgi:hypothetical protein